MAERLDQPLDDLLPKTVHAKGRIATSKCGTDHIENLQLLCGHCNKVKGDRGVPYLRAKLQLAN